jgi:hypothetical protein
MIGNVNKRMDFHVHGRAKPTTWLKKNLLVDLKFNTSIKGAADEMKRLSEGKKKAASPATPVDEDTITLKQSPFKLTQLGLGNVFRDDKLLSATVHASVNITMESWVARLEVCRRDSFCTAFAFSPLARFVSHIS